MIESEHPIYLSNMSFSFCQDGNTLGTTSAEEKLNIECEFQDFDNDPFYVLKTDGFSIDGAGDIEILLKAVNEGVRAVQEGVRKKN